MTNQLPSQHTGQYNPGHLLTSLQERLQLKNDAALSQALHISRDVIARIRERRQPVAGALLIRMHEVSQLSVASLRELMGDRRRTCRMPLLRHPNKSASATRHLE